MDKADVPGPGLLCLRPSCLRLGLSLLSGLYSCPGWVSSYQGKSSWSMMGLQRKFIRQSGSADRQESQPCVLAQSCCFLLDFGQKILSECWLWQLVTWVFGMSFYILGARPGQVLRSRARVIGLIVRQGWVGPLGGFFQDEASPEKQGWGPCWLWPSPHCRPFVSPLHARHGAQPVVAVAGSPQPTL